jgi:hypothetical protein
VAIDGVQTRVARIAGAMYLVQMTAAVIGFMVRGPLIVSGDPTQTARNILASERVFRLSILADMSVVCAVLVVIWALYTLLRPIGEYVVLGVLFRLVENAVLLAVTVGFVAALAILKNPDYQQAFQPAQREALARWAIAVNGYGYTVAFVFCGLGTAVFAYALLRSRYVPRLLAGFCVLAALLFAACAAATLLFPANAALLRMISWPPMGVLEVGLGGWLLIRGVRIAPE